ncbi:MAG: hypothetical protein K5985_07895 [Lachnospiraceae bacterium]|nr:hypothetical protein [Lachnospiraceae bacterium]
MACFLVSAAEAVVVTAAKKVEEKKEAALPEAVKEERAYHIPLSHKLGWLSKMLWGGAFLLLIEHMWHGEVVPYFPFLTAMKSPEDTAEMFHEMATVGVSMALLVTLVWLGMVAVSVVIEKRKNAEREGA